MGVKIASYFNIFIAQKLKLLEKFTFKSFADEFLDSDTE